MIVLAGNVGRGQHRDHAGCCPDLAQIQTADAGMGMLTDSDCRVQCSVGQRDVIGVKRFSGDVQMSALVGLRLADAAPDAFMLAASAINRHNSTRSYFRQPVTIR